MKREFKINAVWNERYYNHFGIHPITASLYGDKVEDIEVVTMRISDDQSIPDANEKNMDVDYWGWIDDGEDELSNMVYAKRFLLDMCFPSGIKGSEDSGKGRAYRLEIIK